MGGYMNCCVMLLALLFLSHLLYQMMGVSALTAFKYESIVGKNICIFRCFSRVHTLCDKLPEPICNDFEDVNIYDVDAIKLVNLKDMLVKGHNGLRNRIAEKMNVANMVQLIWDDELADMSFNYLKQCQPFVDDECTKFEGSFTFLEKVNYYESERGGYRWLSQNRYSVRSEFFPKNFIEMALRSWYFEKNLLQKPTEQFDDEMHIKVGKLLGENNYTHLAYALSFRFGCTIGQFDDLFTIVCNYFPFYRSRGYRHMFFMKGPPASNCPTYFPLRDTKFTGLCSGDQEPSDVSASPLFNVDYTLCVFYFIGLFTYFFSNLQIFCSM